ncbi:endolytic transglycosylase MltG [Oceanobacillus sp. CFH 90083]|uniref:endolytic transglycosylase MltG n=1 Tax=Oceanobacillus sp. CFH 90083 TaxID=2592336 RepID=UPI001D13B429|nr:endolytic transglycosylase MltG [Oceanobacillus sp. CFH 90083]
MKQHVRAFAVGLLTSGALLLAIYLFGNQSSGNLADTEPDELISVLEDRGYAVLTQDEYIAYIVGRADPEEAETDSDADEAAEADANNDAEENESTDEDEEASEENGSDEESNENAEGNNNNSDGNEDEEVSEESDVIEVEITLEDGAPPSTISNALEDAGLIDDAWDFNDFLEDNDLSGSVKPGTYEINSEMSFSEIGDIITTYSE